MIMIMTFPYRPNLNENHAQDRTTKQRSPAAQNWDQESVGGSKTIHEKVTAGTLKR